MNLPEDRIENFLKGDLEASDLLESDFGLERRSRELFESLVDFLNSIEGLQLSDYSASDIEDLRAVFQSDEGFPVELEVSVEDGFTEVEVEKMIAEKELDASASFSEVFNSVTKSIEREFR